MTKKQQPKKKPAPKPKPEKRKGASPAEAEHKQPALSGSCLAEEKPDLTELEAGSTTILDILSPTAVDTKSRDYIVVVQAFHAYLYVAGYRYSTTVAPLLARCGGGEGVI